MIIGNVNANREAIIQIAVLGEDKKFKSIKPVIDTGYKGYKLEIEGKVGGIVRISSLS